LGTVMGVRAMLIAPTAMYPVACLLMAAQGWWAGNLEAVFAAPITALRLALLAYPLTVILLWVVYRRWRPRSALLRKVAVLTLALAAYFALIRPLGLFRFPAGSWPAWLASPPLPAHPGMGAWKKRSRAQHHDPPPPCIRAVHCAPCPPSTRSSPNSGASTLNTPSGFTRVRLRMMTAFPNPAAAWTVAPSRNQPRRSP